MAMPGPGADSDGVTSPSPGQWRSRPGSAGTNLKHAASGRGVSGDEVTVTRTVTITRSCDSEGDGHGSSSDRPGPATPVRVTSTDSRAAAVTVAQKEMNLIYRLVSSVRRRRVPLELSGRPRWQVIGTVSVARPSSLLCGPSRLCRTMDLRKDKAFMKGKV